MRGASLLSARGELGAMLRRHDWTASTLGQPAAWSPSLRSMVGLMLDSGFPMFVAWGPDLSLLYNDAYRPFLGVKHPESLGAPFQEVWAEIWNDIAPLVARALAGEAVFQEDMRLVVERNGYSEETWWTFAYSPARDDSGAVAGLFCACTETTKQVLALGAVQESEDNYRHAVDLSPQTVWTAGPDGRRDQVGSRWREWTGTGGLGSGWSDAVHPDDLAPSITAWTRSVATGEPYDVEHRARFRDGSYRWMRSRAYPRRDASGAIARWYGTTEDIHAVRAAEAALRESEARFRNAADQAPVMMWVTDPGRRCTYRNRRWYEYTGQAEADVPGLGWTGATHPEDSPAAEAAFLAASAARAPFRTEYRLRAADGGYRWMIDAASPRFGEDGAFLGYVGSVIDIDDRKRAEGRRAALDELGARVRDLDDPAELSFAAAEVLGRALGVSRAGYGTIDTAAETITIERDWNAPGIESLAGTLRFRDYGSYIEDLKRGETVVCEDAETDPRTEATAEALKAISARSFVNMPVTEQGGFVALLYLNHEAARGWSAEELAFVREAAERTRTAVERRRAEQELRGLAASLERQVERRTAERDRVWTNSRDLLAVIGAGGVFRAANPAWAAILGYGPSEVVGRSFLDFVWPADAERTRRGLDEAAPESDLTGFENRCRHKDGMPRWISWRTSFEGGLVYAYGRDVTAEKEQAEALRVAEDQLRQSQKMEAVGQLTGGIAHDFNNLLTGITGSLELLGARIAQGRIMEVDRYVAAAQGAAKRAAALTHRLLAFSRRQTLDPKPTDLNRLVAGMEELVRRTMGPEVAVEVVAAGGLWTTLADPNQLENALLNLCINARDAMPDGGRLTIETGNKWLDDHSARERDVPPGQYVALSVSDSGTGMPPEVVQRAFDPFFTTKPLGMGTGLGLSMIYGFVRQSGGQVRIYSEPAQGTMVRLYLPRHLGASDGAEEAAAQEMATPRAEQGETVLVVDDEPTVRMLLVEVLEDLGYTAIEAADGKSGLRAVRSEARIDLLVTDVGLPGGMNGRQMAEAARQARPGLKVLFITGYAENAVLNHGHLEPGMHVLTKPFRIEALANRIKELIGAA